MNPPITRREREVLDFLSQRAAFSHGQARGVYGWDDATADKLARRGVLNKRFTDRGTAYWIRPEGEPTTGASPEAGFVVILHRDLATPSGRTENFFLARAPYDGKGTTFRRLLRGWMRALGLRSKDLLGGSMGFELVSPDAEMFSGDHVILRSATGDDGG